MKILFITDKMDIGGAETHIFTLCRSLMAHGYDITLASAGGRFADMLKNDGVRCIPLPLDRRSPLAVFRSYLKIKRLLSEFDIVHAHTRFCAYLTQRARGRQRLPRIVTTAHLDFPKQGLGRFTVWGDITLAVSPDIKSYLMEEYGVSDDKIITTVNGINSEHFTGKRAFSKNIIHISRIDKGRSLCALTLVKIAPSLYKRYPNYRIIIAGGGDMLPELIRQKDAANRKLGVEYIRIIGPVSDAKEILAMGGIFVGVSRAALEGMAMGLSTVIAGDDGYGGIICEDNLELLKSSNLCARGCDKISANRLFSDISELLSNEDKRQHLESFCRETVRRDFSDERMARDAMLAYNTAKISPTVALVGYFGFGNLGDEETLVMGKKMLLELGIDKIEVLSRDGEYKRNNPLSLIRAIRRCDIVIFTGGTLLQNETSLRSLIYYSSVIHLAKLLKKRVYFISSGLGKIRGALAKIIFRCALRRVDRLGLRTEGDIKAAEKIRNDAIIMPDLCFLQDAPRIRERDKSFAVFASEGGITDAAVIERIKREMALSATVIALFKKEDRFASLGICTEGEGFFAPSSFSGVQRLIARADFTVSTRLHGAIFSVISHKICFLYSGIKKNEFLLMEIQKRAAALGVSCPVLGFGTEDELLTLIKKEIEVSDLDFEKIICDLRYDIKSAAERFFD